MVSGALQQFDCRRYMAAGSLLLLVLALAGCSGGPLASRQLLSAPQSAAAADHDPVLRLSPDAGQGGVYVQASGSGWPPNMMVIVALSDPSGRSSTLAANDTDHAGNLSTGFLYPIDSRWLSPGMHEVIAESADGKWRASAEFTVLSPGVEATPAPVALASATPTGTPTTVATATPLPTATPTAMPTPTALPTATAIPEEQSTAAASDDQQGKSASGQSNRPPVVDANFVRTNDNGKKARFRIEVTASDPDDNLRNVVATLLMPPFRSNQELELKVDDKIEIKYKSDKLEIKAPDPQALLEQIRTHGGMVVEDGQIIETKFKRAFDYKLERKEGILHIEAPAFVLHVTAVDGAGATDTAIVALPHDQGNDDKNRGRGLGKNRGRNGNGGGDDGDDD